MAKKIPSEMSKPQSLRVLMVEDSEDDVLLIIRELKKGGYDPVYERVETATAMKKALKEKQWDIILCDYKLPKFNAPSAIALLKETNIDIPLIIVSGTIGEETAVECMRLGAHDYIMKNNLSRLCPAIARELEEADSRNKRKQIEESLHQSEEKYRNLVERANDGIGIAQDEVLQYVNPQLAQMIGLPVEELIGKPFIAFFFPDEAPIIFERYKQRMTGKKVLPIYETALRHKNGSRINVEVNAGIITYQGKPADLVLVRDITERKRAAEIILHSEKRFKALYQESPIPIFTWQKKGDDFFLVDFNHAASLLTKGKVSDFMGRNALELYRKRPEIIADMLRCFKKQSTFSRELVSQDFAPERFLFVHYSYIPPDLIIVHAEDITERKRAEEALRESEENFRRSLDNSPLGVRIADAEGETLYANQAVLDMYGYDSVEELKRVPLKQRYTPESYADFQIRKQKRGRGEFGPSEYEINIVRENGEVRHVQVFRKEVFWNGAKQFQIIYQDITKRKNAEDGLQKSEEKYRSIVENTQEGIYQSTLEGRHITLNHAFAKMLGYESSEEVMTTITDIAQQLYVNPDDRKKLLRLIEEKGSVTDFETEFYRKDGSKIWVSINMHAVRDDQGHLLYYQGIDQDITEKKKMEAERQENIERLRKSLGATINAMAVTVETRDPYTAGHQRRVADLTRAIATEINLGSDLIDGIRMAGMIHDIGKISIPSEILTKPTQLTNLEFNLIKTHPQSGYNILKDIDFPWPIARIVLEHHERINGSGYPNGLKREQILLESRILAIADVVEAISSHRPYRPAHGIAVALDEISKNRGSLYDPELVDACLRLFREKNYNLVA